MWDRSRQPKQSESFVILSGEYPPANDVGGLCRVSCIDTTQEHDPKALNETTQEHDHGDLHGDHDLGDSMGSEDSDDASWSIHDLNPIPHLGEFGEKAGEVAEVVKEVLGEVGIMKDVCFSVGMKSVRSHDVVFYDVL